MRRKSQPHLKACLTSTLQILYFDSHVNIGNTRAKAIINSTFPGKTFRIGGLVRGTISNGGTQNPLESFRSYTTVWVYARDLFEGAVLPEMVRIP